MIETPGTQNCTVCRKPKNAGVAGSITQWVSVCRCDLASGASGTEEAERLRLCSTCRKRINISKGGSITQWIFSENFCKCEKPVFMPIEDEPDDIDSITQNVNADIIDELYLDVDAAQFPVERYKPIEFLGKGALGEVYLCRDALLGKKVAVKRLVTLTDESVVAFQNEAKIASKLKHPNVISVLDFGTTTGGRPFMVMEYFPGTSLAGLISNAGRIDERDALEIFLPICRSLQYLHDNDVMHRDLKPSNVLVSVCKDGQIDVRLIDFGLSKTNQEHQSKTLLNGHTIVGTPEYMSPDQALGKRYDAQSEIYSLGCLMFETLTGKQPFSGDTALEVLNKHVHAPPPLVLDLNENISEQLAAIVDKCLEKRREERFQQINQIETSLLAGSSLPAQETEGGILRREPSIFELQPISPAQAGRSWVPLLSLVLAAVFAGSGMIWLIGKSDADSVPAPKLVTPPYLDKSDEQTALNTSPAVFGRGTFNYADYPQDLESGDLPTGLVFDGRGPVTKEIQEHVNRKTNCYSVRVRNRQISDGDILLLGKLKPKSIALVRCYGLTERSLQELATNKGLQAFTLEDCNKFPLGSLKVWHQLPGLEQLSLIGAGLTDPDLKSLKGLGINTCSLARNPNLTFEGFRMLGGNTKPTYLFLSDNQMRRLTDAQKNELSGKRNLKLSLEKFNMTRKGNIYTYFDEEQK